MTDSFYGRLAKKSLSCRFRILTKGPRRRLQRDDVEGRVVQLAREGAEIKRQRKGRYERQNIRYTRLSIGGRNKEKKRERERAASMHEGARERSSRALCTRQRAWIIS